MQTQTHIAILCQPAKKIKQNDKSLHSSNEKKQTLNLIVHQLYFITGENWNSWQTRGMWFLKPSFGLSPTVMALQFNACISFCNSSSPSFQLCPGRALWPPLQVEAHTAPQQRFRKSCSMTEESARVDKSPRSRSLRAILRSTRRMILPVYTERKKGNLFNNAIYKLSFRTAFKS